MRGRLACEVERHGESVISITLLVDGCTAEKVRFLSKRPESGASLGTKGGGVKGTSVESNPSLQGKSSL